MPRLLVLATLLEPPTPAGVTIRVVDANDSVLAHGLLLAHLVFARSGALTEADIQDSRAQIRSGAVVAAVATLDGTVVSYGSLKRLPDLCDVVEIVGVVVAVEHRRRGIGAALTAYLAGVAGDRGIDVVMLTADSDEGLRMYERIGFSVIGDAAIGGDAQNR